AQTRENLWRNLKIFAPFAVFERSGCVCGEGRAGLEKGGEFFLEFGLLGLFQMWKSPGIRGEEFTRIGKEKFATSEARFDVKRSPIFGKRFGDGGAKFLF